MMLWIWLGVIIVTAIIELVTIDLVSIWFTLGGIGALIAYALGLNQTIQIIIFIIKPRFIFSCFKSSVTCNNIISCKIKCIFF